jgi:hypothetical protein
MPYAKRQNGNQHCIMKMMDDGTEETMKCHDNEADADAHMAALRMNVEADEKMSMMEQTEFVFEQVSTFGGDYPTINMRPDFQIDDSDSDPVFVTLPIGEVGVTSGNGRYYDRNFYESLVRQVMETTKPITGIVGHENPEHAAFETRLAAMEWVGAAIAESGTVWGKAYIYPEETKLRADVRRAKKRMNKVATSIWGSAMMEGNRAVNPEIRRIDYVDPQRAGVQAAVGVPVVTSEMLDTNGDSVSSETNAGGMHHHPLLPNPVLETRIAKEINMADEKVNADVIQLQETINQLQTYKAQWAALSEMVGTTEVTKAVRELQRRNTELQPMEAVVESVRDALGTNDVVEAIAELKADRDKYQRESLGFTAKNLVDNKVAFEGARPMIAEMIGLNYEAPQESKLVETDVTKLNKHIDSLLEKKYVQDIIKAQVLAVNGGRALVGEMGQPVKLVDTPESRAAARREAGF